MNNRQLASSGMFVTSDFHQNRLKNATDYLRFTFWLAISVAAVFCTALCIGLLVGIVKI